MAAGSMAIAQSGNNWSEQWYRAKYGRPSPTEQARIQAEEANTAYREEPVSQISTPSNNWFDGWYRMKYGRPSLMEQARIDAAEASTAYREEPAGRASIPVNQWFDGWYRAKYGRSSPLEGTPSIGQSRMKTAQTEFNPRAHGY